MEGVLFHSRNYRLLFPNQVLHSKFCISIAVWTLLDKWHWVQGTQISTTLVVCQAFSTILNGIKVYLLKSSSWQRKGHTAVPAVLPCSSSCFRPICQFPKLWALITFFFLSTSLYLAQWQYFILKTSLLVSLLPCFLLVLYNKHMSSTYACFQKEISNVTWKLQCKLLTSLSITTCHDIHWAESVWP